MNNEEKYLEQVERFRNVYEYADARNIFEHIAIQINVSGEGAGILYMEVADRAVTVEPYDYKDRDGEVFIEGSFVVSFLESGMSFDEAREKNLIRYEGNIKKLKTLKNLVFRNRKKSKDPSAKA
ncbi:MAG: hypothetical protein IKR56_07210 [Lachnospiraceae bacterium]|nr:hypothetical protein [Lachnospiraceae bacterium]MBR4175109.1 hypothetical protein [Lachnospiraceae bacterium]